MLRFTRQTLGQTFGKTLAKAFSFASLSLFISLSSTGAFAQKALQEADNAYNLNQYYNAAVLYQKAVGKVKAAEKPRVTFKIGESYRLAGQPKKAETFYATAVNQGYNEPAGVLQYADLLKQNGKYEEAIQQYNAYLGLKPGDKRGTDGVKSSALGKEYLAKPTRWKVENFKQANTKFMEYSPMIYKKNGVIFASSREEATGSKTYGRTNEKFSDLYVMYVDKKGNWSQPEMLGGEVNTDSHEGSPTFTKNGAVMYYTMCDRRDGGCKIFQSTKAGSGNVWNTPVWVPVLGKDSVTVVGSPALSPDEKSLYFVATNAPGGLGGRDIWVVKKSRSGWDDPVNLGPTINTPGDEMTPWIAKNGKLYFASNGHLGMGGLDNFSAEGSGTSWTNVQNLKSPLNSPADDLGIVLDEKLERGYMVTNRDGAASYDLFSVVLPPLVYNVSGTVLDDSTRKPLAGATVQLIMPDSTFQEVITKSNGQYTFKIKGDNNYRLIANRTAYFGNSGSVSTKGEEESKNYTVDINLRPIPKTVITLKDILYDLNKATLRPESKNSLDELVKLMEETPTLRVAINSHTDSRGKTDSNINLSQRRAQSVVDYLVTAGIDTGRLVAKGYGESQLLNRCADGVECTEEEHQVNRRTEFEILSADFKGKIIYKRVTGIDEETNQEEPEAPIRQAPGTDRDAPAPQTQPGNPTAPGTPDKPAPKKPAAPRR